MSGRSDLDLRRTLRLVRYARALGAPIARLTTDHFAEEVPATATAYEVLNKLDLSRFHRVKRWRGYPRDRGGLMRWRLRPKDLKAAADLRKIVFDFLGQFCVPDIVVIRRRERPRAIKFQFLVAGKSHAHVGVLVFEGKMVEKLLAEGRRRRAAVRSRR